MQNCDLGSEKDLALLTNKDINMNSYSKTWSKREKVIPGCTNCKIVARLDMLH